LGEKEKPRFNRARDTRKKVTREDKGKRGKLTGRTKWEKNGGLAQKYQRENFTEGLQKTGCLTTLGLGFSFRGEGKQNKQAAGREKGRVLVRFVGGCRSKGGRWGPHGRIQDTGAKKRCAGGGGKALIGGGGFKGEKWAAPRHLWSRRQKGTGGGVKRTQKGCLGPK